MHVAQTHAVPASSSQAVHPGDVLVLIEEWEIKGASPGQVRELLDGPIGSKVLLTVKPQAGQTRHVEITRGMRPRKHPPHQHTLTPRGTRHESVALDDGAAAYAAESYGQSSNLRHNYEEPAAENPGAVPGARATEAGKPRELVTSLELKGTMQHAVALYQQSQESQASRAGASAEGARGGGGGVVEEPLVPVKQPFASSESRASVAPSDRFGPTSSSASTIGFADRFGPVSSAVGTHFGAPSLTPSVAPSDRFGPASSSASTTGLGSTALRSTSPVGLLPGPTASTRNPALSHKTSPRPPLSPRGTTSGTPAPVLRSGESAYDLNMSRLASAATPISSAELRPSEAGLGAGGIRGLEMRARMKEQEALELSERVVRLQGELKEREELDKKAARKYLQQQAILDQHRHREEQLLRRRHEETAGRRRAEADELSQLREDAAMFKAQVESKDAALRMAQEALSRAQASLAEQTAALERYSTQAVEAQDAVLALRQDKLLEEAKTKQMREERNANKRLLDAAELEVRECRGQILELSRASGDEANTLRQQVSELKHALENTSADAESKHRDSELYKDKIAHTEDVQMELSFEIQELNAQIQQLSDQNKLLHAELDSLSMKHRAAKVQIEAHLAEEARLSDALARQESQFVKAQAEIQAHKAHLEQLSHDYNTAAEELARIAPEAESRRALEALVAEMVDKNHVLQEHVRTLSSDASIEQQVALGSQQTLRAQMDDLSQSNNALSRRLREEQMAAHNAEAALQARLVSLDNECKQLKLDADLEHHRLLGELQEALSHPRVPEETVLALKNNDWAQRLQVWNHRALSAEAEVERLEEALLEEQRNNTFHTLTANLATGQSLPQTPSRPGFQRAESSTSFRSGMNSPRRGAGTLSASWSASGHRGGASGFQGPLFLGHEEGALGAAEDDGWLYTKEGQPLPISWDLVGMVLDVAAWGPGRSKRAETEDPPKVIRALKTLIKSWKALWEKKKTAKGSESARFRADDDIKSVLTNLSSRLHKTERTLKKVLTPRQGNTPRSGNTPRAGGGSPRAHAPLDYRPYAGDRGGGGGGGDIRARQRDERRRGSPGGAASIRGRDERGVEDGRDLHVASLDLDSWSGQELVCTCVCVFIYVCLYVCLHVCLDWARAGVCLCVCVYVCVYMCV